jgi:hypothetical protein
MARCVCSGAGCSLQPATHIEETNEINEINETNELALRAIDRTDRIDRIDWIDRTDPKKEQASGLDF